MDERWQHQLRVYLDDDLAEAVYRGDEHVLQPVTAILSRHDARLVNQFRAFEDYVADAERTGRHDDPLCKWTKATLADPAMRTKHIGAFAVRVADQEVYTLEIADRLDIELRPLVGGPLIRRMSRHDTNPARNIPIPAEYRS